MNYTIKNAVLLDGTKEMKPQTNMTIWVKNDRIVKIEENGTDMPDSEIIDLKGQYIMPGLINMHVHLASSGKPPKADEKPKDYKKLVQTLLKFHVVRAVMQKMMENFAKQQLYSGVTTMRTVGGIEDFDAKVRDKILAGKIEGPVILAANKAVSVPGGHFAGSLATETMNAETAAEDVRQIAKTKPDLIKLMITGGVMDATEEGEPGALRMPAEIVKSACDEAHKLGFQVAAHVESPQGVLVALENGVDTIEHGANPTPEILELFKKRNAAHICTLSPALPYALFDLSISHCGEIGKKNGSHVFQGIIECAKKCLAENVPVGMGTDTGCPFITHYNMWREVYYFKKFLGVSSEFALHTATLKNAKIAGIDKETGSIEVGKYADMIVSKENPLDDFSNLKELSYVFTRGKMIEKPQIRKMKYVDEILDRYM